MAKTSEIAPLPSSPAADAPDGDLSALSRAERRRRLREGLPVTDAPKRGWAKVRATMRIGQFRLAAAFFALGFVVVAIAETSQEEYGFLQLGWLFTLSVYDLVLAMLGLAVAVAMAQTQRLTAAILAVFTAVLLVMLLFFDDAFDLIRATPLGDVLYLVAPTAVFSAGAVLWLPGRWRDYGALVSAAIVAFSFSLFVGLDDLGVGIADFASGALFCALWLIAAPGLLLRQFRGPWLTVPARIIGSWLIVISMIVTVSLYIPDLKIAPPPPQLGSSVELSLPDGTSIPLPDEEAPPQ